MAHCFLCTNKSLDDKFNSKTYKEDIATLSEKKLLNDSDKVLLTSYIISKTSDSLLLDKSYSKLLETAKTEDKIKKENEAKKKQINEQVLVNITKKYVANNVYRNGVYNNELNLSGTIQNNTDRTINGIQFTITFKNVEKITLFENYWTLDKIVKPKSQSTILLSAGVFDNSDENMVQFKIADLSKLIYTYQINKLMFDDGTSIELK
jgi:hypothetical protein